uniref:Cadherin domain-containing protein n=1 Tax=Panagrellus redivivus TaxID=6233 RepID=A0A7E4V0R7_PANRE
MASPHIAELRYNMNHITDYGIHNQSPMIVPSDAKEVTSDLMHYFLANIDNYTCSMTVNYPRAVQKSYKNEKRFFVPPPTVMLEGNGWSNSKFVPGCFGNENIPRVFMQIVGVDDTNIELYPTQLEGNKFIFTAKSMYTSTIEKRKMLTLDIRILLSTNFILGPFISERIRIMSKPSKKKQTAIGPEAQYLSIKSRSRIALYNRLRSQNISTRFFHAKENGTMEASSTQWSVLEILLIRSFSDTDKSIETIEGNINYGDIVALVDVATGIALPPMRIRKTLQIDKACHINEETSGEPVSQLHMVVFEFLDEDHVYLHANPEFLKGCSGAVTHDGAISVNDGCRWTIISAEATTHKFAPLLGRPKRPVAPMPVAWEAEDAGMQLNGQKAIELRGRFPKDDTSVWFGVMKAPMTKIKSRREQKQPVIVEPSCVHEIHVTVQNANRMAPKFDPKEYTVKVKEDINVSAEFRHFLIKLDAVDKDAGAFGQVKYSILNATGPEGMFVIDANTGALLFTKEVDYESETEYVVFVKASDGGGLSDEAKTTIQIEDVNDNAPVFEKLVYRLKVLEDEAIGYELIRVNANDSDPDAKVRYSLPDQPDSAFIKLDPSTGVITLAKALDYEVAKGLKIKVIATDDGKPPLSTECTVKIEILDVNDNAPRRDAKSPGDIPRHQILGFLALNVTASCH